MHDGQHRAMTDRAGAAPSALTHFAAEVVSRLVTRDVAAPPVLREALVLQLMAAVRSLDPRPLALLKAELRRARIGPAALADLYIPEVARRLGQGWHEDSASFAEVSIGAARLQAILRGLAEGWTADDGGARDGPTALVLMPPGEQHTLGAMLATARLRRAGVSVCLRIGPEVSELRALFARRGFDAVLLSVATTDKLEVCGKLVKTVKDFSGNRVPVAVGGAALVGNGEASPWLGADLGADIVTSDLDVALQACGLTAGPIRARQRA
ncbi:cobalamin B12-binding domain-containing protein [Cereibacter changlensis]|uniref:cobalamin B12-binding domain-containing protein n=1 Tax=Cereibacter changlensis TaxID=402884 RepID=UPI0040340E9A